MLNFEFYKDEILEIIIKNECLIGLRDGKPMSCHDIKCSECEFFNVLGVCDVPVINWLRAEYVPSEPKLTKCESGEGGG